MFIPFVVDCFDDEPQCRADTIHVLVHDSLDDCGLACIIQSTVDELVSMSGARAVGYLAA
jgi:hypothetical protein